MAAVQPTRSKPVFPFGLAGRFVLWFDERRLAIDGTTVALGTRAIDLLIALADRPGQMVRKSELLDLVWPDEDVNENNLQVQVSSLRKCLGPDVIQTVPGRGYRLMVIMTDNAVTKTVARSTPAKLTAALPEVIGRAEEQAALAALLDTQALVTLIGSGGSGKTLLAQHLVRTQLALRRNGVCWVELGPVTDPAHLVETIISAVGVPSGTGEPLARLVGALNGLDLLLALDNAEHVVEAVARLVHAIGQGAPGVRMLVTSQVPLRLAGECLYRVGALAVAPPGSKAAEAARFPAVQLFCKCATAADRRFALSEANVASVIELCRRLDGLPLALELAAGQVPWLGVRGVANALGSWGRLARAGELPGRPARHQSLRATLEWSHSLLAEAARRVFRRLSVLAGSATLPIVLHIAADPEGDEGMVLDALVTLVERSIVEVSGDDPPRYRLLDLPRSFAFEQLRAAGEEAWARAQHGTAFASLFDAAYASFYSSEIPWDAWQAELESELANGQEALRWAIAHAPLRAVGIAVTRYLLLQNRPQQEHAEDWQEIIAALPADTPPLWRSRAFWGAGHGCVEVDPMRGRNLSRQATAAAREAGSTHDLMLGLCSLAAASWFLGEASSGEAQAALREINALLTPDTPRKLRLVVLETRFIAATMPGNSSETLQLGRQAAALELALARPVPVTLTNLADTELEAGNVDEAIRIGEELLRRFGDSRRNNSLLWVRTNLTAAWLRRGGEAGIQRALALARQDWPAALTFYQLPSWIDHLSSMAVQQQRPRCAALLIGFADGNHARIGAPRQPNEQRSFEHALAAATAALGAARVEQLRAEGALMGPTEITALVFSENDPEPAGAPQRLE
jgi:predicted ATPase/DNA-binding winged helix-turn-helix (wHTH) protein